MLTMYGKNCVDRCKECAADLYNRCVHRGAMAQAPLTCKHLAENLVDKWHAKIQAKSGDATVECNATRVNAMPCEWYREKQDSHMRSRAKQEKPFQSDQKHPEAAQETASQSRPQQSRTATENKAKQARAEQTSAEQKERKGKQSSSKEQHESKANQSQPQM